jgi:hypothetical protein
LRRRLAFVLDFRHMAGMGRGKSLKPWEAVGWSRSHWYRLGKPAERRRLTELADDIRKTLKDAEIAGSLGWRPSRRTLERIRRIQRVDPDLAYAVCAGRITAARAECELLSRPFLVTSNGTIIPPGTPSTPHQ